MTELAANRAVTPIEPIGTSIAMQKVVTLSRKVANADISVLISGESGTGKEVIARYIHNHSVRAEGPFVAINCAAIPDTMLETTLFGHERGAFTGAQQRHAGKFELADGGTLLLDEVTEMPLHLQAKLLRVLQEREIERLGGRHPIAVDVRVLATSNRRLTEAVAEGHFREDLFYRLSVFPIALPPLREREQDVLVLAEHFLQTMGGERAPGLSEAARSALRQYNWPGNVRELQNVLQRALVLCDNEIDLSDLGIEPNGNVPGEELQDQLRCQEDQLLLDALRKHAGIRRDTAASLGISERTLRHKLKLMRDRGVAIEL